MPLNRPITARVLYAKSASNQNWVLEVCDVFRGAFNRHFWFLLFLGRYCTDLALGPYCQDLGPTFPPYGLELG